MKKITICGSMYFYDQMVVLQSRLEKLGFIVYRPESFEEMKIIDYDKYTQKEGIELKIGHNLIERHYKKIMASDGILIVNYKKRGIEGYIGGNTFLEMGFAFVNKRDIFMVNPSPNLQYKAEIEAMQPILIGEDLRSISNYYNELPRVYLSSKSPLKLDAVSFGFCIIDQRVRVDGFKTKSDVAEQPMSIRETYDGAVNRMKDLKKKIKNNEYSYLISIESGLARLHSIHNYFGVTVCIIERKDAEKKISITTEIEIPEKMTNLVPNPYADLGILVQKKYGAEFKDPYAYLTNGRISRIKLLTYSVENAISQFELLS